MQWFVYALGAAVLLAITDITRKKVLFREPSREYLLVFVILTAFFTTFLAPLVTFTLPLKSWMLIITVAGIAAAGNHFLFKTLKHFDLSTFLPLTNIQPLFILLLGVLFLGEKISSLQFVGIALILTGSYALELQGHLKILHPLRMLKRSKFTRYMFAAIGLIATAVFFGQD